MGNEKRFTATRNSLISFKFQINNGRSSINVQKRAFFVVFFDFLSFLFLPRLADVISTKFPSSNFMKMTVNFVPIFLEAILAAIKRVRQNAIQATLLTAKERPFAFFVVVVVVVIFIDEPGTSLVFTTIERVAISATSLS